MLGAAEAAQRYHQCWSLPQGAVASGHSRAAKGGHGGTTDKNSSPGVAVRAAQIVICTSIGLALPAKNWRLQRNRPDIQLIALHRVYIQCSTSQALSCRHSLARRQ